MRGTLALVGLVEALFARRVVALGERLAFRDRGDSELRSWVVPVARAEGVLWFLLARSGARRRFKPLLTAVGLPMLLAPGLTLDAALRLVYADSETIEVAPWVVPATRAIGLVYVLVGIRSCRTGTQSTEAADSSMDDEPANDEPAS